MAKRQIWLYAAADAGPRSEAMASQVSVWERDHRCCGTGIDRQVHALYPPSSRMAGLRRTGGLTREEIKLVEESAKK